MAVTKTVITSVITRAWNEIEPKLWSVAAGGITATGLITWADIAHIPLTTEQAGIAATILGLIFGYLKKSTSKTEVPPATVEPVIVAPVPADPAAPVA